MIYRGWDMWKDARGVWRAAQYGVTVCSHTKDSLKHVIDHHLEDRNQYFRRMAEVDDLQSEGSQS